MAVLEPGTYRFDQIEIGDSYTTSSRVVTAELIAEFAHLSGDAFEIHLSKEGAARHGFDEIVAHGLLILSLTDGLKNTCDVWIEAQASLGWDLRFTSPLFAGESISVNVEVAGKRPVKDPARGIVTLAVEVVNQDGRPVLKAEQAIMAYR